MRRGCRENFPRQQLQRIPLVSDPGMHHGTCVTHVLWCISGSLTRGGGENVPVIPGTCATRNFAYLTRGPCWRTIYFMTHLPLSPNYSLEAIHCNWKIGCNTRRWGCRKYGLECSLACGGCKGLHCSNTNLHKMPGDNAWMDRQSIMNKDGRTYISVPRGFHVSLKT